MHQLALPLLLQPLLASLLLRFLDPALLTLPGQALDLSLPACFLCALCLLFRKPRLASFQFRVEHVMPNVATASKEGPLALLSVALRG